MGKIPVMYAAANILLVIPLFLNRERRNSKYFLCRSGRSFASLIGASHSSIIIINLLPAAAAALANVAVNPSAVFNSGYFSFSSRVTFLWIYGIISSMGVSPITPVISRYITSYLFR